MTRRAALLSLMAVLSAWAPSLRAESITQREYALKAVFLYNFCQFIEWPKGSFDHESAPIIIGILGNNPFGSLLTETVEGERVRGREIQLALCRNAQDALRCHLIFVSDAEMPQMTGLRSVLRGQGIVTVGESESFLDQGGMIALPSVGNKIKLRINLTAVRAAKIEMSSKLLRVADIKR